MPERATQAAASHGHYLRPRSSPPKSIEWRIHQLPQELQDTILDFVLTIPSTEVQLTTAYKPPWQLSVDRRTRRVQAKDYYRYVHFYIPDSMYRAPLVVWMRSIPAIYRGLIAEIRIDVDWTPLSNPSWQPFDPSWYEATRDIFREALGELDEARLDWGGQLRLKWHRSAGQSQRWVSLADLEAMRVQARAIG